MTGGSLGKRSHLTDFEDKAAVAIRLRTATASLTDLRDWEIARQYIRELETSAMDVADHTPRSSAEVSRPQQADRRECDPAHCGAGSRTH